MNTTKIIKLEKKPGDDFFVVTFKMQDGFGIEEFDLEQLGEEVTIIGKNDWDDGTSSVTATGVTLKVGDAITDDEGGEPVLGAVRTEAQAMPEARDMRAVEANREWKADYADKHKPRQ